MHEKPDGGPLKAKFQIGSVHGTLNYSHHAKAFHHSDVPEQVISLQYRKSNEEGVKCRDGSERGEKGALVTH
jgi:hypothetical protein